MEHTTVLLVMDMQVMVLGTLPNAATFVGNVAGAIAVAREKNIPVVYVTVGFRPGMPEVSANNKILSGARERMASVNVEEVTIRFESYSYLVLS